MVEHAVADESQLSSNFRQDRVRALLETVAVPPQATSRQERGLVDALHRFASVSARVNSSYRDNGVVVAGGGRHGAWCARVEALLW